MKLKKVKLKWKYVNKECGSQTFRIKSHKEPRYVVELSQSEYDILRIQLLRKNTYD